MGVGAVRIGVGFECDSLAVLHATAWRTTMRTCGGVDANSHCDAKCTRICGGIHANTQQLNTKAPYTA